MEARNGKKDRFQIDTLEERIAPAGVSQALGNDSGHVTGSVDITAGPGGASGTITVDTPGTSVNITVGEGPA
jgi:hypothetical protein